MICPYTINKKIFCFKPDFPQLFPGEICPFCEIYKKYVEERTKEMNIDYNHHDSVTTANPINPMNEILCSYTHEPCVNHNDCSSCNIYKNTSLKPQQDMVNHPPHYTAGKFECIDVIKDVLSFHEDAVSGWLTGQIIKYIWRWPLKNGVEDLKKTRFYLDKLIAYEESKNEKGANNGDLSNKS